MTTQQPYDFVLVSLGLPIPTGKLKPETVYECQTCFALIKRPDEHWNTRHRTVVDPEQRGRPARIEPAP